uniref:Uncharacterized protein n=1 Tax=Glossina palpalis gambiensis TaxID=67801 RepID=A0A1B0B102_9MUSC
MLRKTYSPSVPIPFLIKSVQEKTVHNRYIVLIPLFNNIFIVVALIAATQEFFQLHTFPTSSNDFTQCTSTAGTAKNIPLDSSPQRFTQNDNFPPHQQFFNCAAPKSVLHQNCQVMRQVQKQYPPYPRHVGVYQIHPPPGVPFGPIAKKPTQQKLFTNSTLPSSNQTNSQKRNNRRTTSILKHYKSCPVSPVHEEVEWSAGNKNITITEPKRHSVYAEDARTIFDIINSDTEKMIKEIATKYGDLDDIGVNQSLRITRDSAHQQQHPYVAVAPKHSFSEFYVYQEFYRCQRKVSLSDILNETGNTMTEVKSLEEARFLEGQRHSSASFVLWSQNPLTAERSQESLLYIINIINTSRVGPQCKKISYMSIKLTMDRHITSDSFGKFDDTINVWSDVCFFIAL